jgi:alkylation response protein AidB-like acyl-CoA dehydrogenase
MQRGLYGKDREAFREAIGAIAMTEPGAGSDQQGIRTTAVRDHDAWVLNGARRSSPTAFTPTW